MIEEVNRLMSLGKIDEARNIIATFNQHQQLQGTILKSRISEIQGKYQEAHDLAAEALAISIDEGRHQEELGARVALSYALIRLNRNSDCLEMLELAEALLTHFPRHQYQQVRRQEATLHNIRGLVYRYNGQLAEALASYRKSLEIRQKLGIAHEVASSKTNIGTVYQLMGELQEAERQHQEARQAFEELNNQHLLAYTLHSLGGIYWELDNLKEAISYFERALSIRLNRPNHHNTAHTLYNLTLLNLEYDYPDHAQFYFDMLRELLEDSKDDLILPLYQISQAMILKQSNRLVNRAQAQHLFESLLEMQLTTDLIVTVYLNLSDLYIQDLKLSKNEDLLTKLENLFTRLYHLAKQQSSTLLRIETLLLRARLFLVKLDIETAQQLLFQAELMANQKGLHNLSYRISAEHDELIDRLYQWDKLQKRNASLLERMEEVNFSQLIDDLRLKRQSRIIDRNLEKPHFLIILNSDAIPLYTAQSDPNVQINKELIGSFLVASDMGMAVALDDAGSIERIKYGDYTLIFIHHDRLIFCYAYQGQSYYAIRRLQDFIDRIRLSRAWDHLRSDIPRPKLIEQDLGSKVNDYFSDDGIYSKQILQKFDSPVFE